MAIRWIKSSLLVASALAPTWITFSESRGDVAQARSVLDGFWNSLETLSFRSIEYTKSRFPEKTRETTYDFHYGKDGRLFLRTTDVRAGAVASQSEIREDGTKRYEIRPFPQDPDTIDSVFIKSPKNSPDHYQDPMNLVLWILMPAGKSLASHLQSGASLNSDSRGRIVLSGQSWFLPFQCTLDPEHDYLPDHLTLGDALEIQVTKFQSVGGRWFPAAGTATHRIGSNGTVDRQAMRFTVTDVKINEPLPESLFRLPPLASGVRVVDETKRSTYFTGSYRSRKELLAKYPPQTSPHAMAGGRITYPEPAAEADASIPWGTILAIVGGLIVISGLVVKLRRPVR
jgi:hypothetical protein